MTHSTSPLRWAILSLGVLSLAGCNDIIRTTALEILISGQVTDGQAAPLEGVEVAADQCGLGLSSDTDNTDASGAYEVVITHFGTALTTCIRVVATPPAALNLRPDTVQVQPVSVDASSSPVILVVDFELDPI